MVRSREHRGGGGGEAARAEEQDRRAALGGKAGGGHLRRARRFEGDEDEAAWRFFGERFEQAHDGGAHGGRLIAPRFAAEREPAHPQAARNRRRGPDLDHLSSPERG